MTVRQAIASFLQSFVVFVFFSASLFFFCLAYLPQARIRIEDLLLNHPSASVSAGIGFFIASLLLTIGFYGLNRAPYLRIKMGKNSAEIDSRIIRQTLEEHYKGRFPEVRILGVEIVRKKKMEISVELAQGPEEIEKTLSEMENELVPLLKTRFGYSKAFELIAETRSSV